MFEKYFDGVIEQVYGKVGKTEKNIVMACYNNSFSVEGLENIKRYSTMKDNVFFTWKEYVSGSIIGAYDPFLDIICQMHRIYGRESFDSFLSQCGVYEPHRDVLNSYYENGVCKRRENVLLDEVEYEQKRMAKTICLMLKRVAEYQPVMIVINRFQMASKSTMELIRLLIENSSSKIGIVLGVNEARIRKDSRFVVWEKITELLGDSGQVYHIGSSGRDNTSVPHFFLEKYSDYKEVQILINNIIELLDIEQANYFFSLIESQIIFEEAKISERVKLDMYFIHTKVAILLGDMSKAFDIVEDILKLEVSEQKDIIQYRCAMILATCYMYQGKLDTAAHHAESAKNFAQALDDEEMIFKAEVLMLRTQMSGWHNIFFCVTDVKIEEGLIEKLIHNNYRNHLAHCYIYAYDNRPEMVAKAYHSEDALIYFVKGINLAKEIGNEQLVCKAFQKNAMIASTNGMNQIALLYAVRTYQYVLGKDIQETGRMFSAIGYNLSALGHMEESAKFYERAISIFYHIQLPEDIAEVCYNIALTRIAQREYAQAEEYLQLAIKTVDRLNLNSLRVCNLAKLYALQALLSALQGNHFDSERYLLSCAQFLNYILEKQDEEIVHDFARSDDDICLYHFAKAMHELSMGDDVAAYTDLEKTEKYFVRAEGNLFYIHALFRESRMKLFQRIGRVELYEKEQNYLQEYELKLQQIVASVPYTLLQEVQQEVCGLQKVEKVQIENLIRQESLTKENKQNRRQLEFISIWQNLLDKTDVHVDELVKDSIRLFLNRFNNDCALYVRYDGEIPSMLYNDTGISFSGEKLLEIERRLNEYPQGFAVSKISHTFFEHRDMISIFDEDEVCSFVAVPFFKDGKLESYFITYIKMKDNWHDSVNRYLLNDDDLKIYQMLFRELGHAIHRVESYKKIYQMNKQLQEAATTDVLTGITNRMGMYQRIRVLLAARENMQGFGVMFIDLDNFKPYNDMYGHEIGDIVLQGMAHIFEESVGDRGFVCRYGGDEFIIITYTDQKKEIEDIVKSIYTKIDEVDGFIDAIEEILQKKTEIDSNHKISCSIGISTCKEIIDENQVDNMIKKADDTLYSVKAAGKGRYVFT